MPGIMCIREKILDNVEQALDLEDLAQLLLRLTEQRDPRGLAYFGASPRQEPEALFARRLAQHVFVLEENPADAVGEADLAWFESDDVTRCIHRDHPLSGSLPRRAWRWNTVVSTREYHAFPSIL